MLDLAPTRTGSSLSDEPVFYLFEGELSIGAIPHFHR